MIYTIDVNDVELTKQVDSIINAVVNRELSKKYGQVDDIVAAAVKEIVYAHKEEIIERCVKRASAELVRKGLPRLLEQRGDE